MNLKQETVRLLNYRVHELKRMSKIRTPTKSPSFFESLSSEFGYEVLLTWIQEHYQAPINENPKQKEFNEQPLPSNFENSQLNEFHVMQLFGELFIEVYEFQIYELYDLFHGHLTFQELYVIVVFAAALEENRALEYLYMFCDSLFGLLVLDSNMMDGLGVKRLLKLIGFRELEIRRHLKALNIDSLSNIGYEDFELLLFFILEQKQQGKEFNTKVRSKSCLATCSLF